MSTNYVPTDADIEAVVYQVPDEVTRDIISEYLIKNNGDVTETILAILTNDTVVPKNTSPKRSRPKQEVDAWNAFYKDLDKYNIENNIERVKSQGNNDPNVTSSITFE
jgi:hypothetical protein